MTDPIKIKSIAPSFAQTEPAPEPQKKRSIPWPLILVLVVVVGAFLAIQFIPTQITYESSVTKRSVNVTDRSNAPTESDIDEVLPFRDTELLRAQESAKAILAEFAELQDQVEDEQLGLRDYQDVYDAIIDAANQADASFARREYEVAIEQYRDATARLREYVYTQETKFEQAFETGYAAIISRELNTAQAELGRAKEIKPNDESLSHVLNRLEKLPQVNSLIRESRRALLRKEYDRAELLLIEAREVDPETQNIDQQLLEIQQIQLEEGYKLVLTEAYSALNQDDLDTARRGFERALRMRPNDPGAITGLNEVLNRVGNSTIGEMKATAERYERDGDLRSAMQVYAEVLELDNNLQFALDGHARTQETIRITAAMERIFADPDMLSSNDEFVAAQSILKEAQEHASIQSTNPAKVSKLATLLETASKPLPIVLVSDNEMEVRLATVGQLEPFDRKVLSLRPGRYLLTGSANGCRDVRKTIVVTEGMDPIAIVCVEPI